MDPVLLPQENTPPPSATSVSSQEYRLPSPWPPTHSSGQRKLHSIESLIISSVAPSIAVLFTNPFDTAKVRLQLQGEVFRQSNPKSTGGPLIYNGSFDCMLKTFKNEGLAGLQKGLYPAILREATKNLFRLGMFDHVLSVIHPHGEPPPTWKLMLSGAVCGAMGAMACNPFELVKTRLQSSATGVLATVGHQHNYTGVVMGLRSIFKADGWAGLYRGSIMSVSRSMVGSGSNLASYHIIKAWLMADPTSHPSSSSSSGLKGLGWKDDVWTDMVSGLSSGLASVICMNPIDVLRTRYYNQPSVGGGQLYISGLDVFRKVVVNEGYRALYKGFSSHFLRIGPHFCLTFVFLGILRRSLIHVHDCVDYQANFNALDLNRSFIMEPNEIELAIQLAGLPPAAVRAWTNLPQGISLKQFAAFSDDVRSATLASGLRLALTNILGHNSSSSTTSSSSEPSPVSVSAQRALIEANCRRDGRCCSVDELVTQVLPHAQGLEGPLANSLLGRSRDPKDLSMAMDRVLHAWVKTIPPHLKTL